MNKQDTRKIMFLQIIWFTFLVVSLVACFFACIILGINSKNVAHAEDEEPVRLSSNLGGYMVDNVLPFNYCGSWTFSYGGTSNDISNAVLLDSNDYAYLYVYGDGTINNNVLNGTVRFRWVFRTSIAQSGSSSTSCGVGFGSGTYSGGGCIIYGRGTSLSNSFNNTSINGLRYRLFTSAQWFIANDYVDIYVIGIDLYLSFFFCYQDTFNGYVSPDYKYYGYNQGYQDGLNVGGGSSTPNYEDISSSGVVHDNLLDNNNCSAWNYQINVQARNEEVRSNRTIYTVYGSGANDEWTCTMNNASLSNYVYTPQANDSYLLWTYPSSESFSTGSYTFTIGYSGLSSIQHTGYYIAMQFINSQSRDEPLSVYVELDSTKWYCSVSTEITGTYDTLMLTLDSGSAYGVSGAINLGWIKLEQNDYFSGYVPVDYSYYGYNEGYTNGYNLGYDEGTADSNTTYTSNIYRVIGGVQYSIQYEFPSSGGSGVVSNVEHRYFMYNGVQVGNTSWSLGSSADTHIASMTISSYEGWYTALYLGDTVGANTYYFVFNISDNDNWSIVLYDRSQSAINSIFNVVPNVIMNGYNAFAFDTNGSYEIYLTRINQASYRGEDIDLHFEDYMHIPFTTSNIYIMEGSDGAFSNGYNEGFSRGESSGFTTGYSEGYNVGAYDSSHYTFNSLLGAVFDAPITAMKGLLDFDILGTNLYGFMLALISIGLVLFILRVFVRGL